jgi:hypothetical protein
MIWELRIVSIIMVTPLEENGVSCCSTYWPNLHVREWYGDLCCECTSLTQEAGYTIRRVKCKKASSSPYNI